jgi:hypothetical protein
VTPNPSLGESDADDIERSKELKKLSKELMDRECKTLLFEIKRLERTRNLMELRLKNVMALVLFASMFLLH